MVSRMTLKVMKIALFLAGMATTGIFHTLMVGLPSFDHSSKTRVPRLVGSDDLDSHSIKLRGRSPDSGAVTAADTSGLDDTKVVAKQPSRCIKRVHIFSSMTRMVWTPELNHFRTLFDTSKLNGFESDVNCTSHGYECDMKLTLGTDLKHLAGKDAVVFGMIAKTWTNKDLLQNVLKHKPEPGQTWIFYSTETPYRVVKWAGSTDIALFKYHVLMTYNRRSDIHVPFGYYRPFKGPSDGPNDTRFLRDEFYKNRMGLLSWDATNCKDVFWPRMPFVEKLRSEISLDDYGACGQKKCLPERSLRCNRLLASYKFHLSIPNAECRDYITEHFWMISLKHGAVPLVLGTVKKDYEQVAPPNSFVHFRDFKSIKKAADHLKRVDKNETLYRRYHEWRRHGEVVTPYPYHPEIICRTLPHIHPRPAKKWKVIGHSVWYKDCRAPPSKMVFNQQFENIGNWTPW